MEVEVEHDIAASPPCRCAPSGSTSAIRSSRCSASTCRTRRRRSATTSLGNVGDVDASGLSAGIRAAIAGRVHGSVEYTMSRAQLERAGSRRICCCWRPSAVRLDRERIHDVSTSIETDVPETATRVVVLYRVSNAFARAHRRAGAGAPALDSRFDVQVRQSLPFMDFSSAKWEMLVAVRNFFRETAPDQSIYDELLVVRPPKRIVGGLTLKF